MKLLLCDNCQSVFSLSRKEKTCDCGACGGKYIDNLNAEFWGKAIPLGMHNFSLGTALSMQPQEGWGKEFKAFVIPKVCKTMEKKDGY